MRVNRPWCGALLCGLLIAACAHLPRYRAQPQADGSYRLDCRDHLTQCLTALEEVCRQGYEIVQAHEVVRYAGPREFTEPTITGVVSARCRTPAPLLGGKPAPATAVPASVGAADAAPTPVPPRTCFPGSTQACIGPGACKGGQQCRPDGAAFGPCDCGGVPAPPSPDDAPSVEIPAPR